MKSKDLYRYTPQIRFFKIGEAGQRDLTRKSAAIIGCGAVGTVVANSLARMGIHHIRLIDDDVVKIDNLQRQILFNEKDAESEAYKVLAAKRVLEKINSEVQIESIIDRINNKNINDYLKDVDIIFDGTDNLLTRRIINNFAVSNKTAYVYGAAAGANGTVMLVVPEGPCLNCLIGDTPSHGETAQTAGILNQTTMIVGSMESTIGTRYLLNDYDRCVGSVYTVDVWNLKIDSFKIKKNPNCPVCNLQ